MSRNNPFRKPATSEEVMVVPPPSPPLPALPHRTPSPPLPALPQRTASSPAPPALPPRSAISSLPSQSAIPSPSGHDIHPNVTSTLASAEDIDDLPPPYTPAANAGEETVSMGPSRPFQRPPPPSSFHPPLDSPHHSNGRAPFAQPSFTDSGPSYDFRMLQPRLSSWQIQQQYRQRQNGGGSLLGMLINTVRDIADSVSGASPYATTGTVYAPPPLPPPPRPASAPPHSPPPTVPDDGSPTRTPVPGHPLLRYGHLLVYPADHLCVKCKNTGYKNFDPSHPCRKCWEKYGKRYTGALAYTPWSSSRNDPRMQRPLPKFLPPHLAGPSSRASEPRQGLQPQSPQHVRSVSHPHGLHSPGPGPSYYVMHPLSPDPTPPVPHAIPVSPGDPRLGGRLCMRCGGAGVRALLFIDVTTCEDCGGTGRIWV